ncbi:MAG: NAD(P)-dependent oxidoreductase [Armatimonadota bacterium]
MKVLVIGGSGHVGTLVLPFLVQDHEIRVLDRKTPAPFPGLGFVEGDLLDTATLSEAMEGQDVLLYMAMGQIVPGTPNAASAFDVNVKGVYLALSAAKQAGIQHAVYTSSMSVYHIVSGYRGVEGNAREMPRYLVDEDLPPDAQGLYGFTKRMGEEVCRNATRQWGMSINALRLCFPQSREKWLSEARADFPTMATDAEDVARALLASLEFRAGFQAFTISGDYEQKLMRMEKAKRLLGWEPRARPVLG